MIATIPVIIRALVSLLSAVGIGWFAWKLEKTGAIDTAADATKNIVGAVGSTAEAVGEGASALGGSLVPFILAGAAALILMSLLGRR